MKDSLPMPCTDWMPKLAAKYPDDLSYADRIALKQHLVSCPACASVYSAYQAIGTRLSNLPPVEPMAALPYHLLQREECAVGHKSAVESALLSLVACLKSLPEAVLSICVSVVGYVNVFQKLQAVLKPLTRGTVYAGSGNHYLYALQGDSGSLLWQYKKSAVFFSSPSVKDGVAYLTSFDAQIFRFANILRLRPWGDSFLWRQ